jgi:hypothetical protein
MAPPHTVVYRRLLAVRACSAQQRMLIGTWVTPPMTGAIKFDWGGEYYPTIHHGDCSELTLAARAPAHAPAREPPTCLLALALMLIAPARAPVQGVLALARVAQAPAHSLAREPPTCSLALIAPA